MSVTRVQICGVTTVEDAIMCEEEGVDAVGLVLVEGRKRSITPKTARLIGDRLGPFVQRTGIIFAKSVDETLQIANEAEVDIVQTYSNNLNELETLRDNGFRVVSTVLVDPRKGGLDTQTISMMLEEMRNCCDLILFEPVSDGVFGGQGLQHDYNHLELNYLRHCKRFAIAGGLRPDNVTDALAFRPYAVDVSSGVEREIGKKDRALVREFVAKCKEGRYHD